MIVPMKKVSLIVLDSEKKRALKAIRKLGLVHIEMKSGSGARLAELQDQIAELEGVIYSIESKVDKNTVWKEADMAESQRIARKVISLGEEKKACYAELAAYQAEVERLKNWSDINLDELAYLAGKGIDISLYEMSIAEYEKLDDSVNTLEISRNKTSVQFLMVKYGRVVEDADHYMKRFEVKLPKMSTAELRQKVKEIENRMKLIEEELLDAVSYVESMKQAVVTLQKEVEFETYATGMNEEELSDDSVRKVSIAHFVGFIPAEDIEKLKTTAQENAWGLLVEDPTEEDDAPTKLQNNKFVSLVYPMTDFLGSVPGYFEPDISAAFLIFIMIFVGIIFGDGGYGLLILGVAAAMGFKNLKEKKPITPFALLLALLGGATIVWGTVTCSWFGLEASLVPEWLRNLSVPVLSNVNTDRIWYPFWTNGEVGLTTSQNVQIFCFSIALVHLMTAHLRGVISNRGSLKMLGDIGSIMQLIGMFYVVLSLVVNSQVFGLGLVVSGIPVGTVAIVFVGVGFVVNFVFCNYEGNILKSILASVTDIVSMLLGVVNVFSDIVSYIRLWAVGLAGAAISATINDMVSPMLGHFVFIIFAVIVLVFGHGLNMILNVLSVIVHGIRLNTLEFSTHVGLSWSGHKYKPFEE